jgi:hypothetical protein
MVPRQGKRAVRQFPHRSADPDRPATIINWPQRRARLPQAGSHNRIGSTQPALAGRGGRGHRYTRAEIRDRQPRTSTNTAAKRAWPAHPDAVYGTGRRPHKLAAARRPSWPDETA